jgi:hypothetical protein
MVIWAKSFAFGPLVSAAVAQRTLFNPIASASKPVELRDMNAPFHLGLLCSSDSIRFLSDGVGVYAACGLAM